jgi:hypothetical protein
MKCLICDSRCDFFLNLSYGKEYADLTAALPPIELHRCGNCGFVLSKTHAELDDAAWGKLNRDCHHQFESLPLEKKLVNQPPYSEQAVMLLYLDKHGVIDLDDAVDYAAGYGTLSNILLKYHNRRLRIFDRYVSAPDDQLDLRLSESELRSFKTVINSAMFEHIRRREDLEDVARLVSADGSLVVHTLVRENIPADPDWFYWQFPVHCAFHTNRSMNILMEQWGFRSSVYSPLAKSWAFLRENPAKTEAFVSAFNQEVQCRWFYGKTGFVDYWKE